MTAPAGVTEGSVPEPTEREPTEPEPPEPAPAAVTAEPGEAAEDGDAGDELALAEPVAGAARARDMSPRVVAAVVFGLIALAGVAVGALAVATHGFRPKTVIQYRPSAVFSLRPGDCINSAPNGLSVTVLSCATPHDGEVFATFSLTGSSWPGDAAVQSQANNGCLSRMAGYLDPQLANAGLAQEYYYPDKLAWRAGVRTVVCEVRASTGQLTGSVRGTG